MVARVQATIDRIEGKNAVLRLDDGQELQIAHVDIGGRAEVGDLFTIQIQPASEAGMSQTRLAHAVLNQLLADESEKDSHKV